MSAFRPSTEALYEDAPCGLLLTTSDGTILRVNQTFCRWIGHDAQALAGRTLQSLLTVGAKIFHQTHWAPLLQMQGSVAEVKLDLVCADGRKVPFVMNAQRREWHGQTLHEVAAFVAQDRHQYETELLKARKRSEQLLKDSQATSAALRNAETSLQDALVALQTQADAERERARFAEQMMGIVSHDLRNPLGVLRLIAQLLESTPSLSDAKRREMTQRMRRAVRAGERLIADMLDFTAAKLGKGLTVVPSEVDVHALVAQALSDLAATHATRVFRHVATGDARSWLDPERVTQLLGNLVINAVTYGAAEHAIEVRSSALPELVTLEVHNRGEPIPADLLPTLFEPMTQGDSAHARRSVGLGLFIVSEIARAHGGSASVQSSADAGTTFTVLLPQTPRG